MHEFAEEYVANLKPRDERYDTRLGDDFYVATFPNGVKTWLYLYKVNEFTRRQTLGIYPEMPLPVALEALYAARRTRAVEAELAEQGLDGSQVRIAEDSPVNLNTAQRKMALRLPKPSQGFLAGALTGVTAGLAIAAVAWMFLAPAPQQPGPMVATAGDSSPPALPAARVAAVATPAEPVEIEAVTEPDRLAASPADEVAQAQPPESAAEAADLGESQQALMQMQEDLAGTLAWAQLTSDVKDGEPVDQLGWIIELDRKPRRVFFFVRVRGMAGDTVTYHWFYEGQLQKEDTVQVGSGWHSPAYSGITLTPERLGRWRVEVFGPGGASLGSEQFEARTTDPALLSLR